MNTENYKENKILRERAGTYAKANFKDKEQIEIANWSYIEGADFERQRLIDGLSQITSFMYIADFIQSGKSFDEYMSDIK